MKHTIARWLRRAADWLEPPAPAQPPAPAPEPELVTTLQDAGPGPQVRLVQQTINEWRAAEYLRRALRRYSPPEREYRA
jgi:hypothetical protein